MLENKLIELEPRLLLAFRALAQELHFGRAAARLFISQPPLSQQIKRLEEVVGAQLFLRTTRSVSLTPAGAVFQAHLERLLTSMDVMLKECRRAADGDTGLLTIGLTPAACASPIVGMLHAYRMAHPDVFLELRETGSLETAAALRRRTIDIGVMRPGSPQADIARISVFKEEICLAVRREHPLARRASLGVDDLADISLINYSPVIAPYLNMRVRDIYAHYGVAPRIVQESSMPTILTLVEAGSGAALAPRSAIQAATLQAVPLRDNPAAYAILEVVMLKAQSSGATRSFMSWIAANNGEDGRPANRK